MPTKTTRRSTSGRARKPRASITDLFRKWLVIKDEVAFRADAQEDLRLTLLGTLAERGEEDEKGNIWLDLPEPVEFTDRTNKTFVFTTLKAEKHVSKPTPDPEKAEALLRKKKLWLTPEQEKTIVDIQTACPYVVFNVAVDVDALDGALFKKIITPAQYDSILKPARDTIQFRPQES